jgi:AsmA protein
MLSWQEKRPERREVGGLAHMSEQEGSMRWVVRVIGVLVILVIVAVAALFLIPAERIANLAAQQFQAATGRALVISGGVTPRVWPEIGASVEGVTLANAEWSENPDMARIGRVDVGVDLSALIGGSIVVRTFQMADAQVLLERDANGRANWEFGTANAATPDPAAGGGALPAIALDRAEITGLSLRYVDRSTGTEQAIEGVGAVLEMPDVQGPATLRLTAAPEGTELEATLRLGSVTGFMAGTVTPVRADIALQGVSLQFDGRAGLDPLALDGTLSLEATRLAPAMALAGQGGAEPLPEAARPLTLGGQVTLAPAGSLHLRNGVLGLGANRIRASLDLMLDGERPNLTGEIASDALDLRPFLVTGDAASGGGGGWPTTPIDASALGLLDARIGVLTGPLQTGFADLDALRGVLTIDQSRAVLALSEVRAWQGALSGDLVANNRSGLSVRADLALRDVNLLPMLRQMADFERLSGTASMDVNLLGSGRSMDAIMRSLQGEGRLSFGAGEILGLDLAGMLRNLDASYVGEGNRTIYESITGSFTVANGVLSNDDLQLEAPLVGVGGTGTVDLGAQTLEYRVTPEALRNAETGEALRVPLLITGPWSAPRFRLDLEGLAEQRLAEERERLEAAARAEAERIEAEARQRLEQRVEEELGVTQEEGESVEDTLRRGLEGRLRGLLTGEEETVAPTE